MKKQQLSNKGEIPLPGHAVDVVCAVKNQQKNTVQTHLQERTFK